jgi:protein gp37
MSENSKIEWTDHTFNTHWGCSKISPGCDGCYAEALAKRFGYGWGDDAPKREFDEEHWNDLLRWDRKAAKEGVRRRVFTNSMSDLFDKFAPAGVRERHWQFIERTPNLDHLLLTKRIGNVSRMVPAAWLELGGWPANAWLGATIVNQEEADRDIPKLLAVPARVRFLSMEPLLGPVDLTRLSPPIFAARANALTGKWKWKDGPTKTESPAIDWVIVGGESGHGARPMNIQWARSLRDQCSTAGVSFLFKQWGEWAPDEHFTHTPARDSDLWEWGEGDVITARSWRYGKKAAGRQLDGRTHDEFPKMPR